MPSTGGEALLRGRTRWLVVVVAIVAIVVLGRSQVGSRLLSLDPGREEPSTGQIEGKLWRLDPDARTIEVTKRVFGIGATSLKVTEDTLVIVGSKEGGFGDLREGLHVRAAWERRKDVRQAPASAAGPPPMPAPTREPGPIAAPIREPDTKDPAAVIDWLLNQKD